MATEPFIGQMQTFAFPFAPRNWAQCNGQLLAISAYTALFSLLGTTYGGNGTTTFALPDLRGRVPVGLGQLAGGNTYDWGEVAGTETVTLLASQMPAHTHAFSGTGTLNAVQAVSSTAQATAGSLLARARDANATGDAIPQIYVPAGTTGTQVPIGVTVAATNSIEGGSQPHTNMQPYQTLNTCIALTGIFPSRN